jgi:uncharacterized membrane protein SirB2
MKDLLWASHQAKANNKRKHVCFCFILLMMMMMMMRRRRRRRRRIFDFFSYALSAFAIN